MRFRGRETSGRGVRVAIIDSGIDPKDPRLEGAQVSGWRIQFGATGHALLSGDIQDEAGHGTEIAAAVHSIAPDAELVAIRIMDARLRTSADLMAAGIETAFRNGCQVVNLSLGTPNMGKALLLRDACAMAVDAGSVVLAAAHPRGKRAYPADLPEAIGVASHPDCPRDKLYYFDPARFSRKDWGSLSGKFLTYGFTVPREGSRPLWSGPGVATAYLSGWMACLKEALPEASAEELRKALVELAAVPSPDKGYA